MTRKGSEVVKAEWIHTDYFDAWLRDFVKAGTVLNMCCGMSTIGDVRCDININTARTHPYGVTQIHNFFPENSFDYVYCDPPFEMYTSGDNRFRWQQELYKIARKALITRRPKVNVNLPSLRHEWYVLEDERPSLSLVRVDYKQSPFDNKMERS